MSLLPTYRELDVSCLDLPAQPCSSFLMSSQISLKTIQFGVDAQETNMQHDFISKLKMETHYATRIARIMNQNSPIRVSTEEKNIRRHGYVTTKIYQCADTEYRQTDKKVDLKQPKRKLDLFENASESELRIKRRPNY
jgi:hypothetical protein